MGDLSIAQDLLEGVAEAMEAVGDTRTLRIITVEPINVDDPGAAPVETEVDLEIEALLFDFDKKYMPGANVLEGGLMAILSITTLTDEQVAAIVPGNFIIDGSKEYDIVKAVPIEASGVVVTIIVQLKG